MFLHGRDDLLRVMSFVLRDPWTALSLEMRLGSQWTSIFRIKILRSKRHSILCPSSVGIGNRCAWRAIVAR
jgi:hypothetical protein